MTATSPPSWSRDGLTRRASKLTLAAVPTAVSCSRAFTRSFLTQWRLPYLADTAELLTSELVTNALTATGTTDASLRTAFAGELCQIQVRLVLAECLYIGVWDRDVNPPVLRTPDLGSESGRGLFLVDCMSKRWSFYRPHSGGKVVWCELDSASPTTSSGLPIRFPGTVPAQRIPVVDDAELLQRVLRRLQLLGQTDV